MSLEAKALKRKSTQRWGQKNKDSYEVGRVYQTKRNGKGFNGFAKNNHTPELKIALAAAL